MAFGGGLLDKHIFSGITEIAKVSIQLSLQETGYISSVGLSGLPLHVLGLIYCLE